MNGRTPTRSESQWLAYCAQVPCIVCSEYHNAPDSPAEIHHISGQRIHNAHMYTLSLCTRHHRQKDNQKPPRWISRHGDGKTAFEKRYATEWALYEIQQREVAKIGAQYV